MEPEAGDKRKSMDVDERLPFFVTFYTAFSSIHFPSNRVLLLDFRSSKRYRVDSILFFCKRKKKKKRKLAWNFQVEVTFTLERLLMHYIILLIFPENRLESKRLIIVLSFFLFDDFENCQVILWKKKCWREIDDARDL